MPKQKTHKGLLKRISISGTGKVMRTRPGTSHLLSSKSGKRKRKLHKKAQVYKAYQAVLKRLLRPGL